jgi:ketosteroid isomerase-like protein
LDSPRVALIRRLFERMETNDLMGALEELLANSAEDVVFEPYAAHGEEIRGHEELRRFWSDFAKEGLELRVGLYSIVEEGDSVIANGWVRTIDSGRLADTQSRWVYRFDDRDRVVSARVERA